MQLPLTATKISLTPKAPYKAHRYENVLPALSTHDGIFWGLGLHPLVGVAVDAAEHLVGQVLQPRHEGDAEERAESEAKSR